MNCERCGLPFESDQTWYDNYCICHLIKKRADEIIERSPKIESATWTKILEEFSKTWNEQDLLYNCLDSWKEFKQFPEFVRFCGSLRGHPSDTQRLFNEIDILNAPKLQVGDIIYRDFQLIGSSDGTINVIPFKLSNDYKNSNNRIAKCYRYKEKWLMLSGIRNKGIICFVSSPDKYFTALKVIKVSERSCVVESFQETEEWTKRIKEAAIDFAARAYCNRGKIKVVIDWD